MKVLELLVIIIAVKSIIIHGNVSNTSNTILNKRALQTSHELSREQKWQNAFLGNEKYDQRVSLASLLARISREYLSECTAIILYDHLAETNDRSILDALFKDNSFSYIHKKIYDDYRLTDDFIVKKQETCISFILFIDDVMKSVDIIGKRKDKVVIVARSSQWRIQEFLASPKSRSLLNLIVVAQSDKIMTKKEEAPYILYTHKLYVDALGSSQPTILTSWIRNNFTREINLFPKKMANGFSGHRFIVSVANHPPYVIKKGATENEGIDLEGIEIRLVDILSKKYNFTTEYKEASGSLSLGPQEAVARTVSGNMANLGIAGLYVTPERILNYSNIQWHTQDCAAFISLASTALPRYRAIMGPFHWTVWLALVLVYLFAIFAFTISEKLTLKHLLRTPEEIENMFWYVYGTFTNCFTFRGKNSWSKADRISTKILTGFYWIFTIIITACYTGSIIAFVTLPIYPAVVDTVKQLVSARYQIGLLDKDGWQVWFRNFSDPDEERLLKQADYVPTIEDGLKNITKAFFWPYAFLGSREHLKYIVQTNFTLESKRSAMHISSTCYVPFNVGIIFPKHSVYTDIISEGMLMAVEAGLTVKIRNDVRWNMLRSSTNKLLAASSGTSSIRTLTYEDRSLNLDDTQGMFLLLGAGFLIGTTVFISECIGGFFKFCKFNRRNSTCSSIPSNPRFHERQSPRFKNKYFGLRKQKHVDHDDDMAECNSQYVSKRNHLVHTELSTRQTSGTSQTNRSVCNSEEDFNEQINKMIESVFGEETLHDSHMSLPEQNLSKTPTSFHYSE